MRDKKSIQSKLTIVLFATYLIILSWIILFKMTLTFRDLPDLRGINLIPFKGSVIVNGQIYISEIINNILAFVPIGIYICMIIPQWSFFKKVLPIFGISLLYEILQYVFAIGVTDITDLIGNTFGGMIGIGFYLILYKLLKAKTNKLLVVLASIATVCLLGLLAILILANI